MGILWDILNEIDDRTHAYDPDNDEPYMYVDDIKNIINEHMPDDPDGHLPEVGKILDKIEAEHPYKIPGDYDTYSQYNEGWSDAIDRVRGELFINTGIEADRWIPVEERLPENAKHKGAFCPKYQVSTKFGVTEGWYNPDVESWYLLIWFMTERYLEQEIDFKRGDIPKIVRAPKECNIVFAWRDKPDPYRPERRT